MTPQLQPSYRDTISRHLIIVSSTLLIAIKLISMITIPGLPGLSLAATSFISISLLLFGVMILISRHFTIDLKLSIFCIIAVESLFANHPPAELRGPEHLAYFMLMISILSPLVSNPVLCKWRQYLWKALIIGLRVMVVASIIMYIPWEIGRTDHTKPFSGCVGIGMLLGIICAIVIIDSAWHTTTGKKKSAVGLHLLLIALTAVILVASGSRCAIMAAICGVIPSIWSNRHNKKMWLSLAAILIAVSGIFAATQFRAFGSTSFKFRYASQHGSITRSRDRLWNARISEFESSPIIGIGFATSKLENGEYLDNSNPTDNREKIREPGSSWLSLLSNTGILGFGAFLWFNIGLVKRLYRSLRERQERATVLTGMFTALWIHGCFEGWVMYAGSLTFIIYWLITSQITFLKPTDENTPDSCRI